MRVLSYHTCLILDPPPHTLLPQVSGYSSSLATFTISGTELVAEDQKELGSLRDMTWVQTQGNFLYGAHEVGAILWGGCWQRIIEERLDSIDFSGGRDGGARRGGGQ